MNPDNMITIVPSYPAPDFIALQELAEDLIGVTEEIQVDIVDGQFVEAISWPFVDSDDPVEELLRLAELPEEIELEMDCMVLDPLQYLEMFEQIGVARVVVHYGSTSEYDSCLQHARDTGYQIGLAVLPSVRLGDVAPFIEDFDYVQVMGIEVVGAQGQPFASEALNVIASIKTRWPEKEVSVDGAVNAETIPALVGAGATRLAPGSAIVKANDRAAAFQTLNALANQ